MKYFLDQTGTEWVLKKIQDSFVRSGGVRLTNTATWTMRETDSFENDISGPVAEIQSIKGNTIGWNQLLKPRQSWNYPTTEGVTISYNGNGSFLLTGATASKQAWLGLNYGNSLSLTKGHKYLISFDDMSDLLCIRLHFSATEFRDLSQTTIQEAPENYTTYNMVYVGVIKYNTVLDNVILTPQIFDLTLMFGAGNEPTTVEEFRAMFPNSYYEHNIGELKSVHIDSIRTVGFNAFDGELEQGEIYTNGELGPSDGAVRFKNYLKVLGGEKYELFIQNWTDYTHLHYHVYDANFNSIQHLTGSGITASGSYMITMPDTAAYLKIFFLNTETGSLSIPIDPQICFHLVHSGVKNGVYEPYAAYNKSINTDEIIADGLKSVSTDVYDELTPTKLIRRVGSVDLGTLTWTKHTNNYVSETRYFWTANFNGNVRTDSRKMRCINYIPNSQAAISGASWLDKQIAVSNNTTVGIQITNSTFDDYTADQVKAALSGEYLYYDYLTPVETVFETPLDWTYVCEDFGTEEWIFPSDISAPHPTFSSTIKYWSNFTDTLRRLSDIYVSHAELSDELKNFSRQLDTKLSGYARYIFINNTYPGWPTIEYVYNELKKRNVETAFIEFNGYFSGKCIVTMRSMGGIADTAIINLETGGFAQDYASYTKEFKAVYDQASSLGWKTQHIILNTTSQTRVSVKPYNQLEVVLDINASSYGSDTPYMSLIFLNENAEAVGGVDCCFPLPSSDNPLVFKRLSSNMIQYRNTPTTWSVYTASIDIADIVLSFRSTSNDNFILYLSEYGR